MNAAEIWGSVSTTISTFTAAQVIRLVLLVAVCLAARKAVMSILTRAIRRLDVEKTLHTFIISIAGILLWVLIVLIAADYIGVPVTSLLAVLSVAGLAVSLAVQGILSNLAGGLMLLSAKPFAVGDFVEAGGVSGTVKDIGLVYTRITTADNKIIFVPNSEISAEKIINYTEQDRRRVDLTFSASYDAPVDQVKRVLLQVIAEHPKTLNHPAAPFARVSKYGASSVEYAVRVWCATEDYWEVYFDIVKAGKEAFDRSGIAMTYDHLNVHMVKD